MLINKKILGPVAALAFGVVLMLIILAAAEIGATLFFADERLDPVLDILERDRELFWRVRPNLDVEFAGVAVRTDSYGMRIGAGATTEAPQVFSPPSTTATKEKRKRLLCLGGSPTFGWGVKYESAYCAVAADELNKSTTPFESINGGQIGYSSHQGRIFLKRHIERLKPEIITIAYVINDVDRYRFFRSNGRPDIELAPQSGPLFVISNLLGRSRFVRFYDRLINTALKRRESLGGRPVEVYRPVEVRVSDDEYRQNLIELAETTRKNGAEPLFVVMPVNLPAGPGRELEHRMRALQFAERAETKYNLGLCDPAVELAAKAREIDPGSSLALYILGGCARREGHDKEAVEFFDEMMRAEAARCGRSGLHYNEVMRATAKSLGVAVADVAKGFSQRSDYLFIDPKLDPIHPNESGHQLAAEIISNQVKAIIEQTE